MVSIARHSSAEQGHAIHFDFLAFYLRSGWCVCVCVCVCACVGELFGYGTPITYFQSQLEQNRLGEIGRAADTQPTIRASCPYYAFIYKIINARRKAKNKGAWILA